MSFGNLVSIVDKIRKEVINEDKQYEVEFSRSAVTRVDNENEVRNKEFNIPVFKGTLEECEAYVKIQALDFMMSTMDIEEVYNREISFTKTWQQLLQVELTMYDYQDQKSWASYTYYRIYEA